MLPRGPLLRNKPVPSPKQPARLFKPADVPLTRSVSADNHQPPAEERTKQSFEQPVRKAVSIADFTFIIAVGVGSFGKVWKAQHGRSGAVYAIKEMNKIRRAMLRLQWMTRRQLSRLNYLLTD